MEYNIIDYRQGLLILINDNGTKLLVSPQNLNKYYTQVRLGVYIKK